MNVNDLEKRAAAAHRAGKSWDDFWRSAKPEAERIAKGNREWLTEIENGLRCVVARGEYLQTRVGEMHQR